MEHRSGYMAAALALFLTFSCSSDSTGPHPEYQAWCDTATGLCWQNPQKDAFDRHDTGVVPSEAVEYCRNLEIGGARDRRLPTIDELRTLGAGSPDTETGVRCVRGPPGEPPPECRIREVPCEEFLPAKTHCDRDLLDQADSLLLNVRLPEAPLREPHQMLAFLYRSHDNWFPPLAPPDGGTDFNQMIWPQFGEDLHLTLRVPGTTYYREELLAGDFQLYVHLQLEDMFPPVPVDGDYVWGEGRSHISFPFDGVEHRGTERAMEITLEPVGCPAAAPVRCPDGSCVSDPALCRFTECSSVPDDARVLTCRYKSLFDPENCADFPPDRGWDPQGVDAFCRSQSGAHPNTVVVTQGNSCLVEKGGFSTATRCAALEDGKPWWAYGVPEPICTLTLFLGGTHQKGPFCSAYEGAGGRQP